MRERAADALPLGWSSADQPPFVGRQTEIAVLRASWGEAVSGLGRAVFVRGAPGVGKSRLVSEACLELHAGGASVVVGSCVPEFGAPYEPFLEPLRALLPLVTETLVETGREEAVEIVAALTGRKSSPSSAPGQARLYDSIVDVVRAAAELRPFILVLEDLQWADVATVRLLARLVEATTRSRWLIIGTARSAEPDGSEALGDAIARLSRLDGLRRIDLLPFGVEETAAYLRRMGVEKDAEGVPARMLQELTGGNPFLVRETWPHVLAALRTDSHRVEMPETVHDLLRARINALDPTGRAVLQYAAVLGQEIDLGELIAVSDASLDETLEQVDRAVRLGLLEPPGLTGGGYRFPHAIARQAVLDQLYPTHVTRMHAKVAVVLDERFPAAPRIVQRLAHHYEAARALGYRQKAADNLERAAVLANQQLAFEEAAGLFERAAACATTAFDRDAFRLRAVTCWTVAADFATARALASLVGAEASPEQRALAALAYEEACARPGVSDPRAAEMLRAALAALPVDASPLRTRCLAALGAELIRAGNHQEGEAIAEEAIAAGRALGDPSTLAHALAFSAASMLSPLTIERTHERAREALALMDGAVHDAQGGAAYFFGTASYVVGDAEGMEIAERTIRELVRRSGAYYAYWISCMHLARSLAAGRLSELDGAMQRVRRDEREFKSDLAPGANALQSYMVRRETGALGRIAPLVTGEEALDQVWVPGLLALYTELGMIDPARRALTWLLDRATPRVRDSADWPAQLAFLAEAAIRLEDRDAASAIRSWLADFEGLNLAAGHLIATFGSADRYAGQLDSLCGVGDPEKSLQSALEMDRRMGAELHVALTWVALAAHRRRIGAPDADARQAADNARAIAEPAGLKRVLSLLHAETGSIRSSGPDGLTAREIEVIRLLADGLSNREVAARLFISEHTAANHVRSILFKIDAENRTQAAIYARERGLA